MGKRKRKGQTGEAASFISRNRAARKLQLTLHQFNRLCIIKGIFPIEPKNRIRAQKGDSKFRPLYLVKDIRFMMHDSLMGTMRKENLLSKKLRSAKHKRDVVKERTIKRNKPVYSLTGNVLERYPSFLDAIKDLSDPLTNIFMFSNIRVWNPIQEHHVSRCQRLRWEFLHYVIEAKCLTKAFIATTGYYYECEILGRKVVWTVPHSGVTYVPPEVDMKIMKDFLEFHIAMLGSVNFRLAGKVNLRYPLKPAGTLNFSTADKKDLDNFKNLMVSLNYPLEKTVDEVEEEEEENETNYDINVDLMDKTNPATRKNYMIQLQTHERKKLFKGLKFFIGQENNRESLTLIIRNCGGEVSWPTTVFPCSKYPEDDETITHQIVDRPGFQKKYMSRYYIQPQWVYDSFNAVTLKPCQDYFIDAALPSHVCPFLREHDGYYIPPEEEMFRKLVDATPTEKVEIFKELAEEERNRVELLKQVEENELSEEEEGSDDDNVDGEETMELDEETNVDANETKESEVQNETEAKPEVRRAKELRVNKKKIDEKEDINDDKMKAFMIHPKNRRLYNKMKLKEVKHERRNLNLKEKREIIELTKMGKSSQQELDEWKPKPKKLTLSEKKEQQYRKKVRSAVKFAKSDKNKNVNKGSK